MDRQEKLLEIKRLTILLNTCREEYYVFNKPSLSDSEYDKLFDKLKNLEEETNFYFSGSPTKNVGYEVNTILPKVKHSKPLLSLDKTKDRNNAANFTKGREALIMYKLDGLTICITYKNGRLVEASTRGNGEIGSIITDNAKTFMNLPSEIEYKGTLKLTGEGIIHRNDFERINSQIPNENEKYKTPRNLAGGSVQQLDPGICAKRNVYFYVFNVIEGLDDINSLSKKLETVRKYGFDTCVYAKYNPLTQNTDYFNEVVDKFLISAEMRSIPIDGIVIMYDDVKYGYSLGKTSHHYRNGIALKFQEEEEESTLLNIEWQVGRTGKITPVAIFKPVILDNTNVSKASLHNIGIMKKLGVKKNSVITIVKKNEIIPQIVKSVGGDDEFDIPNVCPVCGQKTEISNDDTMTVNCVNVNCQAKLLQKISYFASKGCMDIDGLSEKTIEKFMEVGIINSILDIYNIQNYRDIVTKFDGMGDKSFDKLVASIEKSKNVKLENFIAALGIPNVALNKSKIISKRFSGSWEMFEDAIANNFDFTELESFGTEVNKSIYRFFNEVFYRYKEYIELVNLMNFVVEDKQESNELDNKIFVITGTLEVFNNRKELQEKIESLGGKVAGSVSAKTNYLINNDIESHSSKNVSAKKNKVPIITENDFLNIINKQ